MVTEPAGETSVRPPPPVDGSRRAATLGQVCGARSCPLFLRCQPLPTKRADGWNQNQAPARQARSRHQRESKSGRRHQAELALVTLPAAVRRWTRPPRLRPQESFQATDCSWTQLHARIEMFLEIL